jgi:hypothetical protein
MKIKIIFSRIVDKVKKYAHSPNCLVKIAIVLITVLCLIPLLSSGWYCDDLSSSLFREYAILNKFAFGNYLKSYFIDGGGVPGRFYPLSGYAYLLFTIAPNLLLYKSIVLGSIIFCIYLFYCLVKRLSRNEYVALLACVIIPAFFQFRNFYDPILSFADFMPLIFSLTFSSLIFLDRFLETKKFRYFFWSFVLYTISLYTYEITYLFFLLHLAVIYFRKNNLKDVWRYGKAFLLSMSVAAMGSIYTRIQFGINIHDTYKIHFIPKVYLLTVLKQLYAALPFSYTLSNPSRIFIYDLRHIISKIHFTDMVVIVLFLVSYFSLIKRAKLPAVARKNIFIFGLLLFTLPAIMIPLSSVYQYLLVFGIGHIPVYIQYFGACLWLMAVAVYLAHKVRSPKIKQWLRVVLAVGISAVYLINLQHNRLIVEKLNIDNWYPRHVLEVAAKNGLFDSVPTASTLIMEANDSLSLDDPSFIYSLVKREIFTLNSKKILPWYQNFIKSDSPPSPGVAEKYFLDKEPVYIYRYWSDSTKRGYVAIAKVSDFRVDPNFMITPVRIKNLEIFLLGDFSSVSSISFPMQSIDAKGSIETKSITTVLGDTFEVLQRSKEWSLFRIPIQLETNDWIDFQSVRLNPMPEPL